MKIQRTIPLIIKDTSNLLDLVVEYNRFQKAISGIAYNSGKPLPAIELHKKVYYAVPSTLPSQMKCSAIRNVASAYSSARKNRKPATKPFSFKRIAALFLFTKDFSFTRHGKISISTSIGREKLDYNVPNYAKTDFTNAVSYDSITVLGSGKVHLCLTLDVPDAKGNIPVGIDLGATNALVASTDTETLFISGKKIKVFNQKTRKTRQRLQKKLADHKAQKKDTKSVRRLLKRLGRKHRNRSRTFCLETAANLCKWVPTDAVLVFEDLRIKQVRKDRKQRSGTRRKLSQWFFNMMTQACINKAERLGIGVDYINPAYTSQRCRKCGKLGVRKGHKFSCECGHVEHSDINASHNIRLSFTVLRNSGLLSTIPETLPISG
jgi:IS605 OrfB family transposase